MFFAHFVTRVQDFLGGLWGSAVGRKVPTPGGCPPRVPQIFWHQGTGISVPRGSPRLVSIFRYHCGTRVRDFWPFGFTVGTRVRDFSPSGAAGGSREQNCSINFSPFSFAGLRPSGGLGGKTAAKSSVVGFLGLKNGTRLLAAGG